MRIAPIIICSALAFVVLVRGSMGMIRAVPSHYPTIQSAINATADRDTVLVSPGLYKENINFRGKRIVVASEFLLTHDASAIYATVIDGGSPVSPDTASCVIIASGEDSTAVLEGFTLTGGRGTKWEDKHNHRYYREGGGVLTEHSSPIIRYNRIIGNSAANKAGVTSAGGGAIRSDGGVPRILGNLIASNTGLYGAGITLNYTGAIIRNNIIYGNTGGQDYGGSGIWAYATFSAPIIVENNSIVGNVSALDGGGVLGWSTSIVMRDNIIWGNSATAAPHIALRDGATVTVTYSDVEGGWSGNGNLDVSPHFLDSSFVLAAGSPLIDAGDPGSEFNDPGSSDDPSLAAWPSKGGIRNDIGAFGGPGRVLFEVSRQPRYGN